MNENKTVLTDDEIRDIEARAEFSWHVPRAIEQAVLSKLRAPVADESPMAKVADALREKARQEQQAYQERREADRPASAPVAGEAQNPVAWRYQTPTGWHATTDAQKAVSLRAHHPVEPLYAAPQASEAVRELPKGWQLALNLAIDAIENAAPAGQDWPVNWPAILHGLTALRAALSAQPAQKEQHTDGGAVYE